MTWEISCSICFPLVEASPYFSLSWFILFLATDAGEWNLTFRFMESLKDDYYNILWGLCFISIAMVMAFGIVSINIITDSFCQINITNEHSFHSGTRFTSFLIWYSYLPCRFVYLICLSDWLFRLSSGFDFCWIKLRVMVIPFFDIRVPFVDGVCFQHKRNERYWPLAVELSGKTRCKIFHDVINVGCEGSWTLMTILKSRMDFCRN